MNLAKYYDYPAFHEPGKPYMSRHDRAAQFMPFKSLNGYHDLVQQREDTILDDEWEKIIDDESLSDYEYRDRDFYPDDDGDDAARGGK